MTAHGPGPRGQSANRWRLMIKYLVLIFSAAAGALVSAADFSFSSTSQITEWNVDWGGRRVMVYAFAPSQFKPYVKELHTLNGDNVLRDAPSDHLHHHALMYAIRVNGINFWEETAGCGVQRAVKTQPPVVRRDAAGHPEARLVQTIHWVAPQHAFLHDTTLAALLIEERALTLSIDESQREVALHWQSAFTVGTNSATLAGANYFGLGLRFRQGMDPLAEHYNAGGKPDLSGGKQDVTRHAWGSVSFAGGDFLSTVAVYGHPRNPRGDAYYFTMKQPFAYISATQGLDKEPITYDAGSKYTLDYLVTVHPAILKPEAIEARGKSWLEAR
jgi:hypothetical protein